MFTIYSEKEIFEDIILFNDINPTWYRIFCNHSDICLNMTDAELLSEEVPNTPIFEYIMANGGRSPVALKDYFDSVYSDPRLISDKPRSVFFLNYSPEVANGLQDSFGVIVQSPKAINDNILKGTFYKELQKGSVMVDEPRIGWNHLINFSLPPSNSIVIVDEYLFKNEENNEIIGKHNVVNLLNSLLPSRLQTDYHILLITQDHDRSQEWCERFAGELKAEIVRLRKYSIKFELVFSESMHKRKIMLNYMSITCDKGFCVFKVSDSMTVRDDNDFRCERIFNRLEVGEGDTDFTSSEIILGRIKNQCKTVKEYINNRHSDPNNRILGDCMKDKTIINRLINDV